MKHKTSHGSLHKINKSATSFLKEVSQDNLEEFLDTKIGHTSEMNLVKLEENWKDDAESQNWPFHRQKFNH